MCTRDGSKYPVKPPYKISIAKLTCNFGGCGVLRTARPGAQKNPLGALSPKGFSKNIL